MGKVHNFDEDAHPTKERRTPKPKFQQVREDEVKNNPLVPMNEKQRQYIQMIESQDMVIATGWAGTSKTYIPTVMACDWFRTGKIKKIVFTRPNISNSKSLGMFKGDLIEKCQTYSIGISTLSQFSKPKLIAFTSLISFLLLINQACRRPSHPK